MIAKCIKTDPLGWVKEGIHYKVEKLHDKWFVSIGYVLSDEAFNEHFEITEANGEVVVLPGHSETLPRDKDGFLTHDVSDLYDKLPFWVHNSSCDTYEYVDQDNFLDWSNDLDTKPKYDMILF